MEIPLRNRAKEIVAYAIIDAEDASVCKVRSWHITPRGRVRAAFRMNGKRRQVFLHRFLLNFPDGQIDHINGNPLDNRRSNLRVCNNSQNQANRPLRKGRDYKGTQKKGNRWKARITIRNKDFHLGSFRTEKEAAAAYNEAAKKAWGEFARLNEV